MPRPICFMIMPYGVKPTQAEPGQGPTSIDYDALWNKALLPLLESDLHYHAVRADQDIGAMIIQEMIQRLALADLVVADVTTPNGNVYYEVGVRHAARETGCVMISADWSRPLFDIGQMRMARYPLPEGEITDETADRVRAALRERIEPLTQGKSPVFETLPGYPDRTNPATASSFQQQMEELSQLTTAIRVVHRIPRNQRRDRARKLVEEYRTAATRLSSVAYELAYLLRDTGDWAGLSDFVGSLPDHVRSLPVMRELRCLAQSKTGDHFEAIAALEELIRVAGESSERRGLLGGRYKALFKDEVDPEARRDYLSQAIAEYDRGMRLDLNDYYPSSNLPRLLRARGGEGDERRAQEAAVVTVLACERALARNPDDPWVRPTQLGAAFDTGSVETARRLASEVREKGAAAFHLQSTIPDLETAIELLRDPDAAGQLRALVDELRTLLPDR